MKDKKADRRLTLHVYLFLALVIVASAGCGFLAGRALTPPKIETRTETVYKPIVRYVEVEVEKDTPPETKDPVYYDVPLSHSLQNYIFEICADKNVPVPLIMALIEHESGFNADAVSKTNDYGLMQINAVNHDWLEEKYRTGDMLNPYQNVYCGVEIIHGYLDKYTDIEHALMAYNMGDGGAKKAWSSGITSTKYTRAILNLMENYERGEENAN